MLRDYNIFYASKFLYFQNLNHSFALKRYNFIKIYEDILHYIIIFI